MESHGSSAELEEEELAQLVWQMKDSKSGLEVKERKAPFSSKVFKHSFVAKDAVTWLVDKKVALSREEAVQLCEQMLKGNFIFPATKSAEDSEFSDGDQLFRFTESEEGSFSLASSGDFEGSNYGSILLKIVPEKTKYNLCVLGSSGAGKSSFIKRFISGEITEAPKPTTTDAAFKKENFSISPAPAVELELLDTPPPTAEEFEKLLPKWVEWATGYFVLFNVGSKSSFDTVPKVLSQLFDARNSKITPIVLVGSKCDESEDRKISKDDGLALAQRYRCPYIEISAKSGERVSEAVQEMVDTIKKIHSIQTSQNNQKTGWLKIKKITKGGGYAATKKRFVVATESGMRYYKEEPTSATDTSNLRGVVSLQYAMLDGKQDFLKLLDSKRRHSDPHYRNSLTGSGNNNSPTSPSTMPISITPTSSQESASSSPVRTLSQKFTLPRKNSFQGLGGNKDKNNKFFIVDNSETIFEFTCPTDMDKDDWFLFLQRCIEKLNTPSRKDSTSAPSTPVVAAKTESEGDLSTAISTFNKKPKKGIELLISCGTLEKNPAKIASFLYTTKSLKKSAVGEYMGGNDPFQIETLQEFCKLMDFTGMAFDDALRLFLSKFTLPREAQMIDRVMERFAMRFCQCEPKIFSNPDVGYILAFSLIMLNTDAHNDNIKPDRKMTKLQFVVNNRGIDNGKDLPKEYLEELYDKIVSNAFQMEHERDDFAQWDKQGFIYVKETKMKDSSATMSLSKKRKVGKKLWCIISSFCLFIFASPQDKTPINIIPLDNLEIDTLVENASEKEEYSGFILYNKDPNSPIKSAVDGKEVHLREIQFHLENRKLKMEWMLTFKLNLVSAPTYKKKEETKK